MKYKYTKILNMDEVEAELFKSNKEYVGKIHKDWFQSITGNLNSTSSITYRIPATIISRGGAKKTNPIFEYVKGEMLLEVNGCVYVIKDIKQTDGVNACKDIVAYSREIKLARRDCNLGDNMRQIYSDELNVADGIINDLEKETTWSMGYLDDNAKYDIESNNNLPKYRYFDATQTTKWLDFLRGTFSEAFRVLTLFDTKEKKIDIFDIDTFGEHSGLTLSVDNFIKEMNISRNTNEIITRLYCGLTDFVITEVNPTGKNYIEDFSYFIENTLMSEELIKALKVHEELMSTVSEDIVKAQDKLSEVRKDQLNKDGTLKTKQEELVGLQALQSSYIATHDDVMLADTSAKIDILEKEISELLKLIANNTATIDECLATIESLASSLNRETVVDSDGNKIFTEDMLEELDEYIFENTFTDTSYLDEQSLFEAMKNNLDSSCRPSLTLDVTTSDFIKYLKKGTVIENKLKLGDFVTTVSERYGELEMRVIGYTMSKNNLKITLSNNPLQESDFNKVVSAISQSSQNSSTINNYKPLWDKTNTQTGFVTKLIDNGLDLAASKVSGASSKNRMVLLESGMYIIDAEDENNQVYIGSSLLAFTDNKWESAKTAIDKDGVMAEALVGTLILGEKLIIGDEAGTFTIIGNKLTITDRKGYVRCVLGEYEEDRFGLQLFDKTGKDVVFNEDGLIQRYHFYHADNVDAYNGIKFPVYFDEGVSSIKEYKLTITPELFRSYSKTTEGGGATISATGGGGNVSTTSGGGGSHNTASSTYTNSDITSVATSSNANEWIDGGATAFCPTTPVYGGTGDSHYHMIYASNLIHTHTISITVPKHSHNFNISIPSHSHSVSIPSHTHVVTLPAHTHTIEHGIYQGARASNISVLINGVTVKKNINTVMEIDVAKHLIIGSNTIEIVSQTIGRISVNVNAKVFARF